MVGNLVTSAGPGAAPAREVARHELEIAGVSGEGSPGEGGPAGVAAGGDGIGHALDGYVWQESFARVDHELARRGNR